MKKLTEAQQAQLRTLLTELWERWGSRGDQPAPEMRFVYQDDDDWLKSTGAAVVHMVVMGNWRIACAWFDERGNLCLWRHRCVIWHSDTMWRDGLTVTAVPEETP